jgi:3-dehydro-4-phosphotetronate decarboxylase
MIAPHREAAALLVRCARSLFSRGYSFGTAGNLSVRIGDTVLISPTNCSFEDLEENGLAAVGMDGSRRNGAVPSKEVHFHLALYGARAEAGAVVHLHSTYATAVSCLAGLDEQNALPIYTPYFAMRIPALPVVPYYPPGAPELGPAVRAAAAVSPAMLLKNHGPITSGRTLREASALAEELEEQSKLHFLLGDQGERLTAGQVAFLRRK